MSWPSAYGYKYTPIGLRQREKKDDSSGTRSICTTVHLPQGGHLLDIERQYGMDGSMSKRETQNMDPASFLPAPASRPAPIDPASSSPFFDAFEPRAPTDFERQADDIIANFRARQGLPLELEAWGIPHYLISENTCECFLKERARVRGHVMDMGSSSALATAGDSKISSSILSSNAITTSSAIKEETSLSSSSSSRVRRAMRKAEEEACY